MELHALQKILDRKRSLCRIALQTNGENYENNFKQKKFYWAGEAEYESFEKLKGDYNNINTFDDLEGKTWVANLPEGRVLIRQF